LKQQIEEREEQRLINQEKNEQEGKYLRQVFEKIKNDNIAMKIEKEKEKRKRLLEVSYTKLRIKIKKKIKK